MTWKKSLKASSLLLLALCVFAGTAQAGSRWWQKGDEGWFFYHDPEKTEPIKKDPAKEISQAPAPKPSQEVPFTEQLQKLGQQYLSEAMQNPTVENLRQYMLHNKKMLDISQNFSTQWQKALMKYPDLDSGVPIADNDKDIYFQQTAQQQAQQLQELSRKGGLFFFYSATCPYCKKQAVYLRMFQNSFPTFTIKAISIDGGAFPEFPDTVMDNGMAARLGVDAVPAIFLAFPPDQIERLSNSLMTPDELKARLLYYSTQVPGSDEIGVVE